MNEDEQAAAFDDMTCVDCDSFATARLELPGGRVVDRDSVPFSSVVAGVTLVAQCDDCGSILSRRFDSGSEARAGR